MKSKIVIRIRQLFILNAALLTLLASCSIEKQIARSAKAEVLDAKALQTAHVGISIFEPAANKYLYNYQGDKYFVPASNTKIPTCYAAMKYLGDSLVGLRYGFSGNPKDILAIQPTGDPTLLHPDYKNQPVWDFLVRNVSTSKYLAFMDTIWRDQRWGSGWTWSDYEASYMAERSSFPIYGNVVNIQLNKFENRGIRQKDTLPFSLGNTVKLFKTGNKIFDSLVNKDSYLLENEYKQANPKLNIGREISSNNFIVSKSSNIFSSTYIPFVVNGTSTARWIIEDSLRIKFDKLYPGYNDSVFTYTGLNIKTINIVIKKWNKVHSQPTDSLLKPMMHRSDNFFAEQSLLMVSNEMLGVMNDEKIIDTLLKTDFKDLPQKPRWADGSGLSRYNLFTPQDFVAILNKMKNEFGMERIKVILPTGGEGTISSYYKADSGYIYGKTGTLSGVVAFSGYLYTKKGKLLIFSTLVNNHQASATDVRRAVEKFLQGVRNKY